MVLTGPPGPPPKMPPGAPPGAAPAPKKVAAPQGSKPQKRGSRRPGSTRRLTADQVSRASPGTITKVASGSGESVLSPPGFSTKQLTAEIATLRQYVAELEAANASLARNFERSAELEAENAALRAEALRAAKMARLPPVPSKPPASRSVDADRMEELEAENERLQNENDELLLEMELIHDGNTGADDSPRLSRKDSAFFASNGSESPSSSASPPQQKSSTGDWSAGLAGFGRVSDLSPSADGDPVSRAEEALALEGRTRDSVAFRRAESAMDGAQPILTITVIKKHKLRGKYNRDFALFPRRIATLNPKNGQITNAWDLCDIKVRPAPRSAPRTAHSHRRLARSLTRARTCRVGVPLHFTRILLTV